MSRAFTEENLKVFEYIQKVLGITLNEGQRMLALPSDKPKLCSAVPGSGKTTALGIAVTCEELVGGIAGNKMHVMTFTTKATSEFKYRHMTIMNKLGLRSNVHVSTIHSMCKKYVEIFHEKLGMLQVETMPDEESLKLLQKVIATIQDKKEIQVSMSTVQDVQGCIGYLNNKLFFNKEDIVKTYQFLSLKMKYEEFKSIREIYQSSQRRSGKLTFDEWMLCFYELLKNNDEVRDVIQQQLDSLFVDEFQDTTELQFEIIRMMKGEHTNLTAVGDQDQSIYRWRGASNVYPLFIKAFPDYEHVKMSINYRCPDYAIQSANALIRNNTQRLEVKAEGTGKTGKLEIIPTKSNQVASLEIAKMIIKEYEESGRDNNVLIDKLVLYRNHSQGMFLVYELASREIPVNTGGVMLPHRDKIVKDLLDIVYFLDNPRSSSHASKCMHLVSSQLNKPRNRDNCPFYTSGPQEHFAEIPINVRNPELYKQELQRLIDISKMVREKKPARQIFEALLPMYMQNYYLKFNIHTLMGKTDEDVQAIERFLLTGINKEYDVDQFRHTLIKVEQFLNESNKDQVGLKIYSVHGAKGLEAKHVYLLDVNGMIQPNPTVIKTLVEAKAYEAIEDYINEERSLMYVAITRTLENLTITYNKDTPSPFNWESGLNEKLIAKLGILTMETVGIRQTPSHLQPQYQQQQNSNSQGGSVLASLNNRGATTNMGTTTQTKEHPLAGKLPSEVLDLFNTPVSTESETLDEITRISEQMQTTAQGLERRKMTTTKTRLEGVDLV